MWPMVGALQAWSPAVDRPDLHSTRQPQSLPDTQGLSRSCSCTWPRMRRLSRPPSAATPPPGAGGTSTGAARKGGAAPSCRPSSLPSWEPCGLLPCSPVNPCFLGAFVGFGSFLGWNLAFDGVDKGCLLRCRQELARSCASTQGQGCRPWHQHDCWHACVQCGWRCLSRPGLRVQRGFSSSIASMAGMMGLTSSCICLLPSDPHTGGSDVSFCGQYPHIWGSISDAASLPAATWPGSWLVSTLPLH